MTAKIPYMTQTKTGYFKYQRSVPPEVRHLTKTKRWDYSLGRDYVAAVDKARAYARTHDDLIQRNATPEDRASYTRETEDEAEAMVTRVSAWGGFKDTPAPRHDPDPGLWRQTPEKMRDARALPPKGELQALAAFAAYAFGDRSTLDAVGFGTETDAALVDVMTPARPADAVDAAVFDAMKSALDKRLTELAGPSLVNPKHTLSHFNDVLANLRGHSANTQRRHKVTTAKFRKFLSDEKGIDYEPSLASITPELLQDYLDHLLADPAVGNGSIPQYFVGLNSVFNHAIKTRKVPGLIVNPVQFLEMPRAPRIEDSMYLPFDDDEIKRVWAEAQAEWAPDNHKSKLSDGRRAAFLMVFRVLLWSGLRPVEAFWLRDHGGVTGDYINVQRTKTGIKRKVPVSDHIADFPGFVAAGGFDAAIYDGKHRGEDYGRYDAAALHEALRRSFATIRERAKITDKRKVLYSTKDSLLQRLRAVEGYNTPVEVVVTGHVRKLEMGRHYGGTLGDDPAMRAQVKRALDQVTYW